MSGKRGGYGKGRNFMCPTMELFSSSRGEALSVPVMQPPPTYPQLDRKPLPIELTTEMNYLIELKRDFTEYMQESLNNVQAVKSKEDIERFCENYENSMTEHSKIEYESKYDWNRMPTELRLLYKLQGRKRKCMDVEKKLIKLEKKEKLQQIKREEGQEEEEEEDGEDKNTKEEEDEEMDEENDYTNEYFDTGENYLSEEENDDDAIYM
jgi:predicted GIY-YIG superfamily endonuclease